MAGSPSNRKRGPNTPEGKAVSSRNRTRHGLYAAAIVLSKTESPAEWEEFRLGVSENLAPEGTVEIALAERAAELLWRLKRVPRAEQQAVEALQLNDDAVRATRELQASAEPDPEDLTAATVKALGFYAEAHVAAAHVERNRRPRLLPDDGSLETIMRYEAHLSRQLAHTLHELEALQQRRNGHAMPLARVSVYGLPGT